MLPEWLRSTVERHASLEMVWDFPTPEPLAGTRAGEWFTFEPLGFSHQSLVLEAFAEDDDPWVDERLKDPQALFEHVTLLRHCLPKSPAHGGCDWLVRAPGGRCAGVLHQFGFSVLPGAQGAADCSVGFAFARACRGTGMPGQVMRHFHAHLSGTLHRRRWLAWVDGKNTRCLRFLDRLGYVECGEPDSAQREPGTRCLECGPGISR